MATRAIVLDVNETLFSIDAVERRFDEAGLDADDAELWFSRVLRDGFALASTDAAAAFPEIASHHLTVLLDERGLDAGESTVAHVLGGFEEVEAHPDVPDGLRAAAEADVTVVTLTNGTEAVTRSFLQRTEHASAVDEVLEARSSGVWKPHPRAYRWAADRLGLEAGELALVAVHPWDVHGAVAAGLRGAWLDRTGARYPDHFRQPDVTGSDLTAVVAELTAG